MGAPFRGGREHLGEKRASALQHLVLAALRTRTSSHLTLKALPWLEKNGKRLIYTQTRVEYLWKGNIQKEHGTAFCAYQIIHRAGYIGHQNMILFAGCTLQLLTSQDRN